MAWASAPVTVRLGGPCQALTPDEAPTRAPLPFLPTNSHGGVNFNRVPLHHRQQMQQMQQAGFLNGGSYGRAKGVSAYTQTQNPNVGYTAELVRKKVMSAH